MLPTGDCDDCVPSYLKRDIQTGAPSTVALSSIPLFLTWLLFSTIALHRLFPLLSGDAIASIKTNRDASGGLPQFRTDSFKSAARASATLRSVSSQRIASLVFSASIGLSAVLVELLLCEISNVLDPGARALGLRLTLGALMPLSILITPALEIHAFIGSLLRTPYETASTRRTKPRVQLFLELCLLTAWLLIFWYIPQASILRSSLHTDTAGGGSSSSSSSSSRPDTATRTAFTEACLERVGIIGISLMASLSGFAAVSSLWQTFGVRHRTVKETDISRKEAGLHSAQEMLSAKESRMRALQRRISDQASSSASAKPGFMGKVAGLVRGSPPEQQELKSLEMEVAGLETMAYALSSSLTTLRARHGQQQASRTPSGRFWRVFNTGFALYCLYRIAATSFSSLRRWWQPRSTFATSDPINNVLALVTAHLDPTLDRDAWSRQISFLLSGVMLLASFNAVLQTFRLFTRLTPSLLQRSQTSLPLVISQIAGCYVIASALLLRSNVPQEVRGVITEALGAPLEGKFVEGWFESWFLASVGLTATGILIGRKAGSSDDDLDDDDIEMGKLS
ncbi:hypothetical protein K431DRAFT_322138 [Polychaeton citri CBS 116435]|uniref:Abscisic acid G-protein coupled receptor-like domain-containing protein n=1 Tax=Polychaeton citri CBS 116435 TaxID=1314669 RepID=A0A9P4Q2Y2_9PEZI|nr:hypothetical protein K431DRAFT_322138 [Polychaeton citri CBS 116435]